MARVTVKRSKLKHGVKPLFIRVTGPCSIKKDLSPGEGGNSTGKLEL